MDICYFRLAKMNRRNSDGMFLEHYPSANDKTVDPDELPIKPSKSGNYYDGRLTFKFQISMCCRFKYFNKLIRMQFHFYMELPLSFVVVSTTKNRVQSTRFESNASAGLMLNLQYVRKIHRTVNKV